MEGGGRSRVVQLEVHSVVNFIVCQGNVVLVDLVPVLQDDLLWTGSNLRRHQLLEVLRGRRTTVSLKNIPFFPITNMKKIHSLQSCHPD